MVWIDWYKHQTLDFRHSTLNPRHYQTDHSDIFEAAIYISLDQLWLCFNKLAFLCNDRPSAHSGLCPTLQTLVTALCKKRQLSHFDFKSVRGSLVFWTFKQVLHVQPKLSCGIQLCNCAFIHAILHVNLIDKLDQFGSSEKQYICVRTVLVWLLLVESYSQSYSNINTIYLSWSVNFKFYLHPFA